MTTPFDFDFPQHHPTTRPSAPLVLRPLPPFARGCFTPWQRERVCLHIEANLHQRLLVEELAGVVKFSTSHFSRTFKRSFGITVHRYVMRRRVDAAKRLIIGTDEPLSGIAVTCGMSDQSHMTRWFRRVVGEPPATWRRIHRK